MEFLNCIYSQGFWAWTRVFSSTAIIFKIKIVIELMLIILSFQTLCMSGLSVHYSTVLYSLFVFCKYFIKSPSLYCTYCTLCCTFLWKLYFCISSCIYISLPFFLHHDCLSFNVFLCLSLFIPVPRVSLSVLWPSFCILIFFLSVFYSVSYPSFLPLCLSFCAQTIFLPRCPSVSHSVS